MSFLCWVNARILGELLLLCIIVSLSGLILVIFFTELVGLAPHNFTEPGTKTMSPVKMLCQILQAYQPGLVKAANDYMIWWWNKNYKDDSVCEKKKQQKTTQNLMIFHIFRSISLSILNPSHQWQSQPGSELAKYESPRAK